MKKNLGSSAARHRDRATCPGGKESVTFTPGPWATSYRLIPRDPKKMWAQQVYDAKGENIATFAWYQVPLADGSVTTNREANAHLCAAAPDLYAAAHHAETVMMIVMPRSHSAEYHQTFKELQAALRKARGET